MNTARIDGINIGLMLISAAMAFVMPFELFLLAYAILGPLHYLTEINWLQKSNFFMKGQGGMWWLIFIGFAITYAVWISQSKKVNNYADDLIAIAFFSSLAFLIFKQTFQRISAIMVIILVTALFQESFFYLMLFGVFVPTLVHVYLFTGLFILFGALKSKSFWGIASLMVFITCGWAMFFLGTDWSGFITDYGKSRYEIFRNVNDLILYYWDPQHFQTLRADGNSYLFSSAASIALTRFIAFAYTYHYLNWFSKTRVIKWHETGKTQWAIIISVWVLSVGMYLYDYKTGLKLLYVLSMLHVFLEFPLNFRTIQGIGIELKKRISPA